MECKWRYSKRNIGCNKLTRLQTSFANDYVYLHVVSHGTQFLDCKASRQLILYKQLDWSGMMKVVWNASEKSAIRYQKINVQKIRIHRILEPDVWMHAMSMLVGCDESTVLWWVVRPSANMSKRGMDSTSAWKSTRTGRFTYHFVSSFLIRYVTSEATYYPPRMNIYPSKLFTVGYVAYGCMVGNQLQRFL